MLILFDTSDWRAVQEDPDVHAAFGRRPEDGCDPFALERVHADLDRRASGTEQFQQREIARIGGEDRGRRTSQLNRARVEGGLTQSVVPEALPVVRGVPIDPSSAAVRSASRNFAPARPLCRAAGPSRVRVRRVSPNVRVHDRPAWVEKNDLVPGIREPQNVALHLTCVARSEGEIGGLERVFREDCRISRDEEATPGGQDRVEWERRGPLPIRERPSGHVQQLRTRIPDFDELIVARSARVDADEERIRWRVLVKRGGGRPRLKEEGFGLALRPEGGGCQDEHREQRRSRTSPGTHDFANVPGGP